MTLPPAEVRAPERVLMRDLCRVTWLPRALCMVMKGLLGLEQQPVPSLLSPPLVSLEVWEEGKLRARSLCSPALLGDVPGSPPAPALAPDGQSRVINHGWALIKASLTCPDPDGHKHPQNEENLSMSLNDPGGRDRPWGDIIAWGGSWEEKMHFSLFFGSCFIGRETKSCHTEPVGAAASWT